MTTLEVLFAPAEFADLHRRDLSETCCVVFDVLRATTTMVAALGNGAEAIVPVQEIAEAIAIRERQRDVLLAGERAGLRIGKELTGGITFDLGNSPREFTSEKVKGKTIVMTTTNGTRALNACRGAGQTLAAGFLNLGAIAAALVKSGADRLLLVCSGTAEQAAYEDALGAGALCDLLWEKYGNRSVADSAWMARELFLQAQGDLLGAVARSRNARRLLSMAELREDVAFCLRRDWQPLIAVLGRDGLVRKKSPAGAV